MINVVVALSKKMEHLSTKSSELLLLPPEILVQIVGHLFYIEDIDGLKNVCHFFSKSFHDLGAMSIIDCAIEIRRTNTLSENEIIRLIVCCVFRPTGVNVQENAVGEINRQLIRRAIYPRRLNVKYTLEKYQLKFDSCLQILQSILKDCMAEKEHFEAKDGEYYRQRCHGEGSIDFVISQICYAFSHYLPRTPPIPRRTCTGYFGPSCGLNDVAILDYEFKCATRLLLDTVSK